MICGDGGCGVRCSIVVKDTPQYPNPFFVVVGAAVAAAKNHHKEEIEGNR